MKDFHQFRESLNENKKEFNRAAKNKDFLKVVKAIESFGGHRAYPEDDGMREFIRKVFKKAGIKKASQLKFVVDMGLSYVIRDNKKWRKDLHNLPDRKDLDKALGNTVDTYGGFDAFYACLWTIYDEGDLEDWSLTGAGVDI